MSLEIEATYEDGLLKPDQPLPLHEHECVIVNIRPKLDPVIESYGRIPASIHQDALDYLTNSPDNSPLEGA